MAGRDAVGAERQRVVEERAELDLAVAQHVGVGRAAGAVLGEEVREHALAVLGGEVDRLELDAEHVGDRRRVDQVLARRAVLVVVVVLPVLHEDADDVVALRFRSSAATDESTPPDSPTMMRSRSSGPPAQRRPTTSCTRSSGRPPGPVILDAAHGRAGCGARRGARRSRRTAPTARSTMPSSSVRSGSAEAASPAYAKRTNVAPLSGASQR